MIIRIGFLAVASVAAFSFSQIKVVSSGKRNTLIKHSENDDSALQQQQIEGMEKEKLENSDVSKNEEEEEAEMIKNSMRRNLKPNLSGKGKFGEFEVLMKDKKLSNVIQIGLVKNLEKEMEQRKVNLERKLLELYGLKEQQSYIEQLRRQVGDKTSEIDTLKIAIDLLHVERKVFHEEMKQGFMAEKQLEVAKKMLKELQKKRDAKTSHAKGRLMMLKEQVSGFQSDEVSFGDAMVEKNVKDFKDVELEVVEMKRRNKELELEKRELAVELVAAKARIAAISNMTEGKIMAKAREEVSSLRHANEELQEQVERLQKNRFDMVEELVYQRWLHTCLRFEVENHQNQSRTSSKHDFSRNSCQKFNEITKQLTSDPGFDSISSNTSSAKSEEIDTTTSNSSSSSQRSSVKKHRSSSRTGLIGRSSMSNAPSNPTMPRENLSRNVEVQEDSTKSLETPTFPRVRRVSFNDSVRTVGSTYQDNVPKSVGVFVDDKEMVAERSTVNAGQICRNKVEGEKQDDHEPSSAEKPINNEIALEEEWHSRIPNMHLVAACFFIFMLLVYFLHLSARIH